MCVCVFWPVTSATTAGLCSSATTGGSRESGSKVRRVNRGEKLTNIASLLCCRKAATSQALDIDQRCKDLCC